MLGASQLFLQEYEGDTSRRTVHAHSVDVLNSFVMSFVVISSYGTNFALFSWFLNIYIAFFGAKVRMWRVFLSFYYFLYFKPARTYILFGEVDLLLNFKTMPV